MNTAFSHNEGSDGYHNESYGNTPYSLTRANGWGSAGECPASTSAKTPAVRDLVGSAEENEHVVMVGVSDA